MLSVSTRIAATSNGGLAFWVASALDGFALGCAPMWRSWRLPSLYAGSVRFEYEPQHGSGNEEFAQPHDVFQRGWGDCDDLVVARLCELYAATLPDSFYVASEVEQVKVLKRLKARVGSRKLPVTRAKWTGESLHVFIVYPNGAVEDPAVILGAPTS